MKLLLSIIISILMFMGSVQALDFDPRGNIIGRHTWKIINFTEIDAEDANFNGTTNMSTGYVNILGINYTSPQHPLQVRGIMASGTSDTTYGEIRAYGNGPSSNIGGRNLLYTAANYDTVVNYYLIRAWQDTLRIGRETNSDLVLDESGNIAIANDLNVSNNVNVSENITAQFHVGALDTGTIQIIDDIDKDHIEGDVNTFVDVAGDNWEGNMTMGTNKSISIGNQTSWGDQIWFDMVTAVKMFVGQLAVLGNLTLSEEMTHLDNKREYWGTDLDCWDVYNSTHLIRKCAPL